MHGNHGRRDFLTGAAAAATVGAHARGAIAADEPGKETNGMPQPDDTLSYRSTGELVAMLAARQISALELLDHAIARIEALDSRINAVVVRDFDRARIAARAADAALARGDRRPLLGIPMTVKEAYNVAGLPTTWGIPAFKNWMPAEDAVAIQRLKAAGAIIIGKTNVPFALSDWQSYNDIYGTTNNPWDLSRTPGGSSGGSAAALASGYVSLELGSDLAGSIRAPAAFCGVFGHKSSYGLIPLRGHTPPTTEAAGGDGDLPVLGPLARTAGDLALALDVLAGPDERKAIAYRLSLPPPRHERLSEFRVVVIDNHPLLPVSAEIRDALNRLSDSLANAGAKISRASPLFPDPVQSARIYMTLLVSFVSQGMSPESYQHMQQVVASLPPEDNSLGVLRTRATVLSHHDWLAAIAVRARLRKQWRELFREYDVVLCPIMPTVAFPHDHSDQEQRHITIDGQQVIYMDQTVWPGVATLPGLPATVVPFGRSQAGLPIGFQIIGPYLEDRSTIAFANLIEREFGGFAAPPALRQL
jgi:amidase